MATSSSKHLGVKDFKTSYTSEKRVASFRKYLSFSRMGNEGEVILRPCSKYEQANMTALKDSPYAFFYMNLLIFHDVGVLIPLKGNRDTIGNGR